MILLVFSVFLAPSAGAQGNCGTYKVFVNGEILTAPDLNASLVQAATTNTTFPCLADYSASAAQMRTTTDPGESGTESLATSGAGELERLRFALRRIHGQTYWYTNPDPLTPPGDIQFGHATVRTARAIFYHSSSAFYTRVSAGNNTQDQWYFWPTARPTANDQSLTVNLQGQMSWQTIAGSGGGWTDDGTIVRLTTVTDQVGIQTASNLQTGAALTLAGSLDWTSGDGVLPDTRLFRGTNNRLEMRPVGGTTPIGRWYGNYTNASNNDFFQIDATSTGTELTAGQAGTGTIRNILIRSTAASGVHLTASNATDGWGVESAAPEAWVPSSSRIAGSAIGTSSLVPLEIHLGQQYNLWIPQTSGRLKLLYTNTYVTIAAAATTTVTGVFPAGSIGLGVTVRVGVAIPTAATFNVGVSGATTRYGSGLSTALGTTNIGLSTTWDVYTTLTDMVITPNLTPADATGRVRLTAYYIELDAPADESTPN